MSTWAQIQLSELVISANTGLDAIKRAPIVNANTGIKCLRIQDISQDKDFDDWGFCEVNERNYKNFRLKENDIIIARTGETVGVNKIIIEDLKAVYNNGLIRLRVDTKTANPLFIYYTLQTKKFEGFIDRRARGISTQPNIRLESLLNYEICNLPLINQTLIATVLSAYDELIGNNEKRIKILEEIAQRLYAEWFVKFRYPGFEKVKMVDSKTTYGMIPKGWEVKKLSDIIQIKKGKNITKNTVVNGDVPVVAGGTDPAYYHNVSNTISPVITISASGAGAGFVKLYYKDIWASDCSYIDKNISEYIYFFYLFLKNKQKEITNLQRGSAQPHVYPKDLMGLKIIYSKEFIIRFNDLATPLFELVDKLKEENTKLNDTRDLLIPQLVTGKRELKN